MTRPETVGCSLSRARQKLEDAGIEIAALHPLKPPAGWKPAQPHDFDAEPYVVAVHTDNAGKKAVLDIVVAWKPGRGARPAQPKKKSKPPAGKPGGRR